MAPPTLRPTISAPELILTLMDSAFEPRLKARYFVASGDLFGIAPRTIRVALTRLTQQHVLTALQRGLYGLGPHGRQLHSLVRNWVKLEEGVKPWTGCWLLSYLARPHEKSRKAAGQRQRALKLMGFAPLDNRIWARPDNLKPSLAESQRKLIELGQDPSAILIRATALSPAEAVDPPALWDIAGLQSQYQIHVATMRRSRKEMVGMALKDRARETLLIGRAVTRDILKDPLLPPELIDTKLRQAMVEAMREYDRLGKSAWAQFRRKYG